MIARTTTRFVALVAAVAVMVGGVLAISPTSASATFSCNSSGPTYPVRPGDGWFIIAARVDVSARSLLEANGAALDDLLVPGDRLCLPGGANVATVCSSAYTVRRGDGWFIIANRVGVSGAALLAANAAVASRVIHPGETICLPAGAKVSGAGSPATSRSTSGGATYTVSRGDSWYGIAQRAGVSGGSLLAANGASASDVIVPGQVIRLPAGAKQPAAAPQRQWVDLQALPIQGPCWYGDTWGHARSRTRRHQGTDLFSTPGNYVYAVVDGRLTGRTWDGAAQRSGNSWVLTAADGTFFFYAHLSDFNPALRVGSRVRAGQILGWIGGTGNASAEHLHFEIHPDGGEAINPYPILRAEGGCNRGRPYTQPGGWVPDRIG